MSIELPLLGVVVKHLDVSPEERRRELWNVGILDEPSVVEIAIKKGTGDDCRCESEKVCWWRLPYVHGHLGTDSSGGE